MGLLYEVYLTNYPFLEQKHNYTAKLREQLCSEHRTRKTSLQPELHIPVE